MMDFGAIIIWVKDSIRRLPGLSQPQLGHRRSEHEGTSLISPVCRQIAALQPTSNRQSICPLHPSREPTVDQLALVHDEPILSGFLA